MKTKTAAFIYWTPRILSMAFILFLSMFSLDVISPELSAGQIILGLFMHNIPSLVLLAILLISWKREIVGGIVFILFGIGYILIVARSAPWYLVLSWSLIIAGPAFLIGGLFLVNWSKRKNND